MTQRKRGKARGTKPTPRRGAAATELAPMWAVIRAAHVLEARMEEALANCGLSRAKLGVLRALTLADRPVSLAELAELQGCVRSNMTQLIDRMEADGLLRRVADSQDRRSIRAALSATGRAKAKEGARVVQALEAQVARTLTAAQRTALRGLAALQ